MELFFCNKCGARVSDAEINQGAGSRTDDTVLCQECAPDSGPESKSGKSPSARAKRGSGSTRTRSGHAARGDYSSSRMQASGRDRGKGSVVAVVAGGLLIGLLGTYLVVGGKREAPQTHSRKRTPKVKPKAKSIRPAPRAREPLPEIQRPKSIPKAAQKQEPVSKVGAERKEKLATVRGGRMPETEKAPDHYAYNGGMEELQNHNLPKGWWSNVSHLLIYTVEREDIREGAQALRVSDKSTKFQGKIWRVIGGETAAALAGKRVRLSVWMKAVGIPVGEAYVGLVCKPDALTIGNGIFTVETEWKQYAIEHMLPAQIKEGIIIYICATGPEPTGEVLVDDVRLDIVE